MLTIDSFFQPSVSGSFSPPLDPPVCCAFLAAGAEECSGTITVIFRASVGPAAGAALASAAAAVLLTSAEGTTLAALAAASTAGDWSGCDEEGGWETLPLRARDSRTSTFGKKSKISFGKRQGGRQVDNGVPS